MLLPPSTSTFFTRLSRITGSTRSGYLPGWLNFDHPGKYPLLVDPVIRESRVKKVLVDGVSSINVIFPRILQGLGVHLKELHESDTPFFGIVPTEGEYPLGHIYMPVTFGTPENYRTEFLRFEVANFDCG